MDRDVDVRTPESIAFTYRLAGLGSRFLALAIDQLIQYGILLTLFFGFVYAFSRVPPARHVVASSDSDKIAVAIVIGIIVFVVFTILFGYFILFEALWNGQTPGKKALGIRVIRDGGYPVDFGASLVRNLVRIGEYMLAYIPSALSTLVSPENKRLGDIAAGTIVVRDSSLQLAPKLRLASTEPVYAATVYLSGEERALVARFLERRDQLDALRRSELAASLAARVRERVPPDLARLDDESLLERL